MPLLKRTNVKRLAEDRDVAGLREALRQAPHRHRPWEQLREVSGALVGLGDEGVEALVDAIRTDAAVRGAIGWFAADALEHATGPRAVELLVEALEDPDASVRLAAAGILRTAGGPAATEDLARTLTDADASVRREAALALAERGDPRALEPLLESVLHDQNQRPAVVALGKLGDASAIPVLTALREASRSWDLTGAVDEALRRIRAAHHEAVAPETADDDPAPGSPTVDGDDLEEVAHLLQSIRNALEDLPVSFATTAMAIGPGAEIAREQIPIVCRNIGDAIAALRAGADQTGEPISAAQVGRGLQALVDDATGPAYSALMSTVLDREGVAALERSIGALAGVARRLRGAHVAERAASRDTLAGGAGDAVKSVLPRGYSSVGRALPWHGRGQEFDSP